MSESAKQVSNCKCWNISEIFSFCIKSSHMKPLPDGITLIRFCVMKEVNKYMTLHSKKFSAFLFFKAQLHQKGRSPCYWAWISLLVPKDLYWLAYGLSIWKKHCNFPFVIRLIYRAKQNLIIYYSFPVFSISNSFLNFQYNMGMRSTLQSVKSCTSIFLLFWFLRLDRSSG